MMHGQENIKLRDRDLSPLDATSCRLVIINRRF